MTIDIDENPIRLAHAWLWERLEQSDYFSSLVPERCRIKLKMFHVPEAAGPIAEADSPLVIISLDNVTYSLDTASNTTILSLRFRVDVVIHGDNMDTLCDVLWAIVRAMLSARRAAAQTGIIYDAVVQESETKFRPTGRVNIVTACVVDVMVAVSSTEAIG